LYKTDWDNEGGIEMKKGLIQGVAVNDAPFKVGHDCRAYYIWKDLVYRCYSPIYKQKHPTYNECKLHEDWLYFSNFYNWYLQQDAPESWHIDKDLLSDGEPLYSKENCVFIDQALNKFTLDRKLHRGAYPLGVIWSKACGKFIARCKNVTTNKVQCVGYYTDPDEAHLAYVDYKREQAKVWIGRVQEDSRYKRQDEICAAIKKRYKI
jgi:hypothetical protein